MNKEQKRAMRILNIIQQIQILTGYFLNLLDDEHIEDLYSLLMKIAADNNLNNPYELKKHNE